MYETPPDTFGAMVAPFPAEIRETAEWLRSVILESCPEVSEGIHGGTKVANALYSVGHPNAVALGLQAGARFVKLFIHDPEHLGAPQFKLEGSGKHMRHIKFLEPPVDRRDELISLIRVPVERRTP